MSSLRLTKELYFTTSPVVDWTDVLTRPVYMHIIVESLRNKKQQWNEKVPK